MGATETSEQLPKTYFGVMVSSTYSDILEHREEAIRILEEYQLLPRVMERDSAKTIDVIESSLQMVRESSAYIGVITHRYGQVPICPERNPDGLSLTELEFNEAQKRGRPILLFVMGDRHLGLKADFEEDPEKRAKLDRFRERAKKALPGGAVDRVFAAFDSLEEFKSRMSSAIANLALEIQPKVAKSLDVEGSAALQSIDQQAPCPDLYGRQEELALVVSAILGHRPVIIAGGPGFGKTALAVAALYDEEIVAQFDSRRILVSFDESENARSLIAQLVSALGMASAGDEAALLRQVQTAVANEPVVAILDNVEAVFDTQPTDANRILGLVAQIPGLHIITTIRGTPPQLPRAQVIEDLPRLKPEPAREAFLAVAGSGFADDPDLTDLVEAIEGHALSIQLLGALAVGLPNLRTLRIAWEDEHAAILRRTDAGEGRLTSIRASLSLSLRTKALSNSPLSKRLLSILANLPAGLAETDAGKFLGDLGQISRGRAFEAVSVLHKLKLVERRLDDRLRMLAPIRESIKLDVGLMPKDKKRLIDNYLDIARLGRAVGTERWAKLAPRVLPEISNIDSVLNLAARNGLRDPKLMDAMIGVGGLAKSVGFVQTGALEYCAEQLQEIDPINAAMCRHILGRVAFEREDADEARRNFSLACSLASASGATLVEANARFGLAHVAMAFSMHGEAYREIKAAQQLYSSISIGRLGYANALQGYADLEARKEDLGEAKETYQEVLRLYEELGEITGRLNAMTGMAVLNWSTAKPTLLQAEKEYLEIGVVGSHATTLIDLGDCEAHAGRLEAALAYYLRGRNAAQPRGRVSAEAHAWIREGQVMRAMGRSDGRNQISIGYELYLASYSKGNPARDGWEALRDSMLAEDPANAHALRETARHTWSGIGRYDLIREWVDFIPGETPA